MFALDNNAVATKNNKQQSRRDLQQQYYLPPEATFSMKKERVVVDTEAMATIS